MSKTIALHGSKDLLIQARKDLVNAGFEDDKYWNDRVIDSRDINHLLICFNKEIQFHTHKGCLTEEVIHITPENYAETIQSIITNIHEYQDKP